MLTAAGHYNLLIRDQCGERAQVCPTEAIYPGKENGVYLIDEKLCVGCAACGHASE